MDENLGVSLNTLVEFFVGHGSVCKRDIVGDNEGGFGSARDDQVAEVPVVFLRAHPE
jgi:hypothetical protein